MNDKTYLKIMVELGEELERAASARPYDPDEYNKTIDALNRTNRIWWRSRRRRPWMKICFCLFLLYCLAWLIWAIWF